MSKGALTTGEPAGQEEFADRQRYPRSLVLCSAQLALGAGTAPCEILNISLGGVKLRLLEPLAGDAEATLTLDRYGTFKCRVAWRDGQNVGLAFVEDLDRIGKLIRSLLDNPEPSKEQRALPRSSVLWAGQLNAGARAAQCRVLNISPYGAKVRLLEALSHATRVSIKIERFGEFPADVIWRDGDYLGIKFHDDPDDIARIFGDAVPILRRWGGDTEGH